MNCEIGYDADELSRIDFWFVSLFFSLFMFGSTLIDFSVLPIKFDSDYHHWMDLHQTLSNWSLSWWRKVLIRITFSSFFSLLFSVSLLDSPFNNIFVLLFFSSRFLGLSHPTWNSSSNSLCILDSPMKIWLASREFWMERRSMIQACCSAEESKNCCLTNKVHTIINVSNTLIHSHFMFTFLLFIILCSLSKVKTASDLNKIIRVLFHENG